MGADLRKELDESVRVFRSIDKNINKNQLVFLLFMLSDKNERNILGELFVKHYDLYQKYLESDIT